LGCPGHRSPTIIDVVSALCADNGRPQRLEPEARRCKLLRLDFIGIELLLISA
jgi:hypothetical protein